MSNDNPKKIVAVALSLCVVCSILVSAAAIGLRTKQDANKLLEKQRNILQVAGLLEEGADVVQVYGERIVPRIIDLETGAFSNAVDAATYDARLAARNPDLSIPLPPAEDIASIKQKAKYATIYLVKGLDEDLYDSVIIPVHLSLIHI